MSAPTGVPSMVPASATAVQLVAENLTRHRLSIYYDDAAILYVLIGTGTPSATNYTVKLGAGYFTLWEPPGDCRSAVQGVWSAATGSAAVAEFI